VRSWPTNSIPAVVDGRRPDSIRVFNSASDSLVLAADSKVAKMYVCGITPYDATHMGHAATYVAFDLLNRIWRDSGYQVRYVQNVTDVDDPLLVRAKERAENWQDLAERQIALFRDDMTELRVLPPDDYVGAVEAIPLVVDAVTKLFENGSAYWIDSDAYFRVHRDPDFGTRSHLSRDEMLTVFAERGGDPTRPGKEDPLDCLLWQSERADEPAWKSTLGNGRPGWHIECSTIALRYLGNRIDVQGGGSDLLFPHHEMGAAEARMLTGVPFARTFVHAGMVGLDGEKMSKSKGNLVLVSELLKSGVDPMAIRLALLADHYRTNRDWTNRGLADAQLRLARWREQLSRPAGPDATETIWRMREALATDLDSPAALKAVDDWCALPRSASDRPGEPGIISRAIDALLGIGI
jgi:L-cysteine:1D-myo-inositol 2-amino-2-deoxy-alpha-D-glucopyranoside ligase